MVWERKTTVLVVEDDSPLRDMYRKILSVAGFAVTAAEDGIEALERINSDPPDAVVLDLALPRLSGQGVQREMATHPKARTIPIVVVTGTDTTDLNEADFAYVLKKPIRPSDLVFAVDNSLRRAHSRRASSN